MWEQALQARVEQQGTVLGAAADNADAAEGVTLTQLRDALVLATDAPGTGLKAMADWLTTSLMIDAETGGSVKTTRVEQAIETLQDLMTGLRDGQIGGFELTLTSAPAAISFYGSSRYDIFARGPDNASGTSGGTHLERLGIAQRQSPVSPGRGLAGAGNSRHFVLGGDGAIWQRAYSAGGWGSWESLGGLCRQLPGCGSRISAPRRLRHRSGRPAVAEQRQHRRPGPARGTRG